MNNLQRLQHRLRAEQMPALLVSDLTNVQWLTGFTGSFGTAIVTPDDALFITDSRYTLQAQEEVKDLQSVTFASPTDGTRFIGERASAMGLSSLGFEAQSVTYASFLEWQEKFGGLELVPTKDAIAPLRMVKTPEEVEKIRRACKLADSCFDHVLRLMQPGVSEYDIALEIEFYFRRNGAGLAFDPIVVSGERSARP
ncbi:MAG TPA: aminopeptidase P family N-terminal domain-containing protein, partial [Fimbriimonadaceae bacterium]|nr:aminopeptidase P family N-terminal domain-containing protein [Fimbriimonadaceae bacterium]